MARLNATLAFWYFLLLVVTWRQLLKREGLQRRVHGLWRGALAPYLQWYCLYFAGVLWMMLYSLNELLSCYDSLPEAVIEDNLHGVYSMPLNAALRRDGSFEDFRRPLILRPWLRAVHLASQFVGIPTVVVAMVHVWWLLALPGKRLAEDHEHWREVPWRPTTRMNWLLLLVAMPAMFSVSAMRASCRVLALMTATSDGCDRVAWSRAVARENALYRGDLELAALFQFSSIYAFGRICGSLLSDRAFFKGEGSEADAAEYTWALQSTGLSGVWAFVSVGMLRALLSLAAAELQTVPSLRVAAGDFQRAIAGEAATVFGALAVLCVLNMAIISRMSIITQRLGNASRKFLGTRCLLLCGEVQSSVLEALTVGSGLHRTAMRLADEEGFAFLRRWNFSGPQARLFHLSLLSFECFFVVLFNLMAWRKLDLAASGMLNFKSLRSREGGRALEAPQGAGCCNFWLVGGAPHERAAGPAPGGAGCGCSDGDSDGGSSASSTSELLETGR